MAEQAAFSALETIKSEEPPENIKASTITKANKAQQQEQPNEPSRNTSRKIMKEVTFDVSTKALEVIE